MRKPDLADTVLEILASNRAATASSSASDGASTSASDTASASEQDCPSTAAAETRPCVAGAHAARRTTSNVASDRELAAAVAAASTSGPNSSIRHRVYSDFHL